MAGRALCVADLAYSSYQMAADFQGLRSGTITVEEFVLRNTLRATRMALEVAFLIDPEPMSKSDWAPPPSPSPPRRWSGTTS